MSRRARRIALWSVAPILIASGLFALGVLWPLPTAVPVVTDHPVAFVGVTLIDVERGLAVPDRTVVVDGGRITAVAGAHEVHLPDDAERIDARERYLLPALWDMHTHVYAISPLLDLPLYLSYGVANVRDMLSCPQAGDPFISCPEDKRRWTDEAERGLRVGPRIVSTASFMANGPGMQARLPNAPPFVGAETPAQARAFVRHEAARGVDEIKVYDRIPRAAYFTLVAEAHRVGLDVVGHRPHAVSAVEAAAAGQKSVDHARVFLHEAYSGSAALRAAAGTDAWREDRPRMVAEHDSAMAQEIFAAFVEHGTWYVPTHLTRWSDAYADAPAVRQDSLLQYLHPLMRWQWMEDVDATVAEDPTPRGRQAYRDVYHAGLALTGAAHRAGVPVLVGTDYIVAGADVHRELEQLVAAGLSAADALRAATLHPARYAGLERTSGSVAVGKVADLLLLDANPLDDIRHTQRIRAVVFNGNLYDRDALDGLQALVRQRARSWAVACKILWRFVKRPASY
ncbi:amidohydrolase family protein [Rubrivirga sp. IMCC45206]|uniref:amidohydrolase family protein n=1 Tax=Rubrivirga sp. IMCC45206 TaxID=3391614 RepID=UPI00398FE503